MGRTARASAGTPRLCPSLREPSPPACSACRSKGTTMANESVMVPQPLRSGSPGNAPGGRPNVWWSRRRDRRPPFNRNKPKLNTESPPPTGGRSKVRTFAFSGTCAGPTHTFFFYGPRISVNQTNSKKSKAESFQGSAPAERLQSSNYFPRANRPPGVPKSLEAFEPGPAAPQHKLFRQFPRNFFLSVASVVFCQRQSLRLRSLPHSEKLSRNSGWGGVDSN